MSAPPLRALAVAAATTLLLTGCVSPARTSPQYRDKAIKAVEAATSEVATARLAAEQWDRHRLTGPYADRTLSDNENALGAIATSLSVVQPPARDVDGVRDDVGDLLQRAGDAAARARIAVRRGDHPGVQAAIGELDGVRHDLDAADEKLGSGS